MDIKLKVYTEIELDININYSLTLITKLRGNYSIKLSDLYLYYCTGSEVNTKFVVNTAVTAYFNTGDILIFSADTFSAAFTVLGIVTISSNFKLFSRLEGKITLSIKFKSKVKLAEWDVY